jgi:hypothetical protein
MNDLVTLGIDHTRLLNNVIIKAGYEFLQSEDLPANVEQLVAELGPCENPCDCDTITDDVTQRWVIDIHLFIYFLRSIMIIDIID